jgi:hypothetical protein
MLRCAQCGRVFRAPVSLRKKAAKETPARELVMRTSAIRDNARQRIPEEVVTKTAPSGRL